MAEARNLTTGEKALAASIFGTTIALEAVELRRRKWWPFQPRNVVMAPCGHLHFHPRGPLWREDFSAAGPALQGLFLHELCHVWQSQRGLFLPLRRLPFARYAYRLEPGKPLRRYGIEQQAEIVANTHLIREGFRPASAEEWQHHEALVAEL
jgi:hypothetical protein